MHIRTITLTAILAITATIAAAADTDLFTWLQSQEPFQGSEIVQEPSGWEGDTSTTPKLTSADGRYIVNEYDDGQRITVNIIAPWQDADTAFIDALSSFLSCSDRLPSINTLMARSNRGRDDIHEAVAGDVRRTFSWWESWGELGEIYIVEFTTAGSFGNCPQ